MAYVLIPLSSDGESKVNVIDFRDKAYFIPWIEGAIIYLPGTSSLKFLGDGKVVCIILGVTTRF